MKKGLWLVVLAICITAGAAWAIDLNHDNAFKGAIDCTYAPGLGASLKKLGENDPIWISDHTLINDVYDGKWWVLDNLTGKKWAYMVIHFTKPHSFPPSGQLRWRAARAAQSKPITCYVWTGSSWHHRDDYTGTAITMPSYQYVIIEDDDFVGPEESLFVLIEVETTDGNRWLHCDVCDIQYTYE